LSSFAEKVRQQQYDFDESVLKPYLPLDRMQQAVFDCANKLYGLRFVHRPDVAGYHPDVQVRLGPNI
jgi:peptidyl-dipeptidase Dcp